MHTVCPGLPSWCRLVLRATLGGRCWHPCLTEEEAAVRSFVLDFLHSFTAHGLDMHQAPKHGDKLGNCTLGPYCGSLSSREGEMICPAAQRAQERCPGPDSQKCQGQFALGTLGDSPSRPRSLHPHSTQLPGVLSPMGPSPSPQRDLGSPGTNFLRELYGS